MLGCTLFGSPIVRAGEPGTMADARRLVMDQKWSEAAVVLAEITKADPDNAIAWFNLGLSLHYSGQLDKGIEATKKAATFKVVRTVALYNVACGYAMKKDRDNAFAYLEQARDAGFLDFGQCKRDSDLDALRSDPRFKAFLTSIKTERRKLRGTYRFENLAASDGTKIKYAVVLPKDFDKEKTYPVLLLAPPGGQDIERVKWGLEFFGGLDAARMGWIVVSPVAPRGQLFFDGAEQYIPELLDQLEKDFRVEGGRFFLAGSGNGGRSAFRLAILYPERFRSLVTFPGYPPAAEDFAKLDRLKGLQVRMFVGEMERQVWIKEARRANKRLRELGIDSELQIIPDEGHVMETLRGSHLVALLSVLRETPEPSTPKP